MDECDKAIEKVVSQSRTVEVSNDGLELDVECQTQCERKLTKRKVPRLLLGLVLAVNHIKDVVGMCVEE